MNDILEPHLFWRVVAGIFSVAEGFRGPRPLRLFLELTNSSPQQLLSCMLIRTTEMTEDFGSSQSKQICQ